MLVAKLTGQGISIVEELSAAEICYVNTCSVTAAADRASLKWIHRALRCGARVVALGCLANAEPGRLLSTPGVIEVWDNGRKQSEIGGWCPQPRRSRAFLKVQDGCDAGCTYCRPSRIRGQLWSLSPKRAREQLVRLLAAGYTEVVITGLNLGRYEGGLAILLEEFLTVPGEFRLRLASLEPEAFDARLISLLAEERFCPHFHIPLQSGDDSLLRRMGRGYTTKEFARLLELLKKIRSDANVGTDVIVGFPGETEDSFRTTRRFLEGVPIDYLHVFPYSRRPGTPEFNAADCPAVGDRQVRLHELLSIDRERRIGYRMRFAGSIRQAVVESSAIVLTDNYLRLRLSGGNMTRSRVLIDVLVGQDGHTAHPVESASIAGTADCRRREP